MWVPTGISGRAALDVYKDTQIHLCLRGVGNEGGWLSGTSCVFFLGGGGGEVGGRERKWGIGYQGREEGMKSWGVETEGPAGRGT